MHHTDANQAKANGDEESKDFDTLAGFDVGHFDVEFELAFRFVVNGSRHLGCCPIWPATHYGLFGFLEETEHLRSYFLDCNLHMLEHVIGITQLIAFCLFDDERGLTSILVWLTIDHVEAAGNHFQILHVGKKFLPSFVLEEDACLHRQHSLPQPPPQTNPEGQ